LAAAKRGFTLRRSAMASAGFVSLLLFLFFPSAASLQVI